MFVGLSGVNAGGKVGMEGRRLTFLFLFSNCHYPGSPPPPPPFFVCRGFVGTSFLSEHGVAHRDVRAENIFLSGTKTPGLERFDSDKGPGDRWVRPERLRLANFEHCVSIHDPIRHVRGAYEGAGV